MANQIVSKIRTTGLLLATLSISGCWAEGNSYFLSKGDSETFISMRVCEKEAKSGHYSGYECRAIVLGMRYGETQRYYEGKLVDGN